MSGSKHYNGAMQNAATLEHAINEILTSESIVVLGAGASFQAGKLPWRDSLLRLCGTRWTPIQPPKRNYAINLALDVPTRRLLSATIGTAILATRALNSVRRF
jgi:hypothetical protein